MKKLLPAIAALMFVFTACARESKFINRDILNTFATVRVGNPRIDTHEFDDITSVIEHDDKYRIVMSTTFDNASQKPTYISEYMYCDGYKVKKTSEPSMGKIYAVSFHQSFDESKDSATVNFDYDSTTDTYILRDRSEVVFSEKDGTLTATHYNRDDSVFMKFISVFDRDGNVTRTMTYYDGLLSDEIIHSYDPMKTVQRHYRNGKLTDTAITTYYQTETYTRNRRYEVYDRNGKLTEYINYYINSDGSPLRDARYKNDELFEETLYSDKVNTNIIYTDGRVSEKVLMYKNDDGAYTHFEYYDKDGVMTNSQNLNNN